MKRAFKKSDTFEPTSSAKLNSYEQNAGSIRSLKINFVRIKIHIFSALLLAFVLNLNSAFSQNLPVLKHLQIQGTFPHLSVVGPCTGRSESGIGALMPWADKLWMIGYVAHIEGSRIGLYSIDENLMLIKHPQSITGTFANRMIHQASDQAIIGPHIINKSGQVRTYKDLATHRLTATMNHLSQPDSMVYFLTMEGQLFEANVYTLEVQHLADLITEFYGKDYNTLRSEGIYIHFKGGFTGNGRVVVANNSYQEGDYLGTLKGGRLAEWDGKNWTILDSTAYVEVNGKMNPIYGNGMWATGWDRKSVKLMYFSPEAGKWRTYRLPKGSEAWEHAWNTEWMRIREAQTERFMLDAFGIFYELPVMSYGGNMLPIKPVCNHLRVIPDYVSWRGLMVLAGDQTDNAIGQPQSNLQFIQIDDLWKWGKPSGWGAVWRSEDVAAGSISDPYLMNGFDKKGVHFTHQSGHFCNFVLEVDLLGNGSWLPYKTIEVPAGGYRFEGFPEGFSAQWVRVRSLQEAEQCTVQFFYN